MSLVCLEPSQTGKILHAADFGGLLQSSLLYLSHAFPKHLWAEGQLEVCALFVILSEHRGHFADTFIDLIDISQKAAAWHITGWYLGY